MFFQFAMGHFMQKYDELSKDQQKLVDTNVALIIGSVIGGSPEIPGFIASEVYMEELRNKFSFQLPHLEKTRYDAYIKAKDAGINIDAPKEYIDRAVKIIKKLNMLNPNQPARAYRDKKAAADKPHLQGAAAH